MDSGSIKRKPPQPLENIKSVDPKIDSSQQPRVTPGGVGELADSVEASKLNQFDKLIEESQQKPTTEIPQNLQKPDLLGQKINVTDFANDTGVCANLGLDKPDLKGVLDQKVNVAEPACSGTLATTCGVPDTDPNYCDTLSGCPENTSLRTRPDLTGELGGVLDQKINVAEPACSGTLATTCGVPDTDPNYCDTLSGCPERTNLSSLPELTQPPELGGVLDQKLNVAEPACSGTLATTCGVPDTDPNYCDTLSGCPKT